tara:strand:- start:290 stop:490 length:201 start_codon:yes stop_codon:yes gene_type:complete
MCEEYKCLVKLGEILATLAFFYMVHWSIVEQEEGLDQGMLISIYLHQAVGIGLYGMFYGIYWVANL